MEKKPLIVKMLNSLQKDLKRRKEGNLKRRKGSCGGKESLLIDEAVNQRSPKDTIWKC
jgi:hypothetical protein